MAFKQWSEKFRSWIGRLSRKRGRGISPLPGRTENVRAGKFSLPLIDWEKIYRKSFLYNSLALVVCAYFLADLLVLGITPLLPLAQVSRPRPSLMREQRGFSQYEMIFSRNLLNERGLIPNADEGTSYDGPPVRTSLPLNLLGVIVTSDGSKSVASIEDKSTNQVYAVRETEPLGNHGTVLKIEWEKVIFLNNNTQKREFVELPRDQILATRRSAPSRPKSSGGITNTGGNSYTIDRKEIDKALENMNEVLTEARCVPHMEAGKPSCYQCFQIVPGSVYDKLGMKNNDVICNINGQNLDDPSKIFSVLNSLKNARTIEMNLIRNGRQMTFNYEIP